MALATSVVTIASAIAPAAFGEALVQRHEIHTRHLDTVFWFCLGVALFLYAVLVLVAYPVSWFLSEPLIALLLPLIGARVIFEMLAVTPTSLVVREMRYRVVALRTALANLVAAVVCISLLIAGYGVWALACAQVVNVAVAAIVVLVVSKWRPGMNFSRTAFRDLFSYGVFASGSRALHILRLDQLLIGALGGAATVGLFNFANRLFQLLTGLISGAFGSVSHSLLSSMQNEAEKVREAFFIAVFGSTLVAFPIFAGLFLIAEEAVPYLFGEQWAKAVVPVQALSLIGIIASIGVVQGSLLSSQGRAGWWFYYQLLVQLSNLPLIFVLMPWGLNTVLVGIAIKALALWPISVVLVMRVLDTELWPYVKNLVVPTISTLFMCGVVLWVKDYFFAVEIIAGVVSYTCAALILGAPRLRSILKHLKSRKAA